MNDSGIQRVKQPPDAELTPVMATSFCVACFFLTLTAASLITVEHLKYLVLADRSMATPARLLAALRPVDLALAAICGMFGLGVIILEWRRHGLSRLLSGVAPRPLALALAAALLWFAHALLAPGLLGTGDAGTHVARVSHLAMAIRDGSSLYWDNYFFAGGTLLQFTGPVFHWIATALTLLLGSPTVGVKVTAVAARFVAAIAMFAFLRRAGLGRTAAAFGCLFFAGSFFVTYLVSIRSTFPQIIVLATLPAMLYGIECVLATARFGRGWLVLCLAAIVLIGDHQPTAIMAAALLGLYVLARTAMTGWRLRPLMLFSVAAATIAVGSVFFLVPFALEQSWTAEGVLRDPLFSLGWPRLGELLNYVLWDSGGTGRTYTAYLGLSILACALAGAPLALRVPREAAALMWLTATSLAIVSLFFIGFYVRTGVFLFTFLCVAAAASVQLLQQAVPAWPRIPVLIFALFLVDAAPSALQPYTRTDVTGVEQAGEVLAQRAATERVLQVTPGYTYLLSVGSDSAPLQYARVQMLHGPHKPDATKAHNAIVASLALIADDLTAHNAPGPLSRTLLGMLNVGWAVGLDGPRMGLPSRFIGTQPDPLLGLYWRFPEATPVLASGRFATVERPASFDGVPLWNEDFLYPSGHAAEADVARMVKAMGIDLTRRQAGAFLVPALPAGGGWPEQGPAPAIQILDYRVTPGRVHLVVQSDHAGLLRLAHPAYPTVTVTLNGQPAPTVADVFSFIVLPVATGRNEIEVGASPSALRRICFAITVSTVLLLLGMLALLPRIPSILSSAAAPTPLRSGQSPERPSGFA